MSCARAGAATLEKREAGVNTWSVQSCEIGRLFYASVFEFRDIRCSSSGTMGRTTHSVGCGGTIVLTSAPHTIPLQKKRVAARIMRFPRVGYGGGHVVSYFLPVHS